MTTKWILVAYLLMLSSLFTACSNSANPVAPPTETVQATAQPDFDNIFAESNQLYDQLEANEPIEVALANDSSQTVVLTMPTLF